MVAAGPTSIAVFMRMMCTLNLTPQLKYIKDHIYQLPMFACILHHVRAYYELTMYPAPRWLDESVGWSDQCTCIAAISFPESSFPLTSGRKTRDFGSNHLEIKNEIMEFCPSGFTAQSASMCMQEMVAPELSFSDR